MNELPGWVIPVAIVVLLVLLVLIAVAVITSGRRKAKQEADRQRAAELREQSERERVEVQDEELRARETQLEADRAHIEADRRQHEAEKQQSYAAQSRAELDEHLREADELDPHGEKAPARREQPQAQQPSGTEEYGRRDEQLGTHGGDQRTFPAGGAAGAGAAGAGGAGAVGAASGYGEGADAESHGDRRSGEQSHAETDQPYGEPPRQQSEPAGQAQPPTTHERPQPQHVAAGDDGYGVTGSRDDGNAAAADSQSPVGEGPPRGRRAARPVEDPPSAEVHREEVNGGTLHGETVRRESSQHGTMPAESSGATRAASPAGGPLDDQVPPPEGAPQVPPPDSAQRDSRPDEEYRAPRPGHDAAEDEEWNGRGGA